MSEADLSVIIPTYNEHENILDLVEGIRDKLPADLFTEIVIADDNSPDGTGSLIADYIKNHLSRSQIVQQNEYPNNILPKNATSIIKLV